MVSISTVPLVTGIDCTAPVSVTPLIEVMVKTSFSGSLSATPSVKGINATGVSSVVV